MPRVIDVGNRAHYVPCGRTAIQNQYAGSSVSRRTCIDWPTGCRVAE